LLTSIYGLSAVLCLLVAVSFLTTRAQSPLCARVLATNYLLYGFQNVLATMLFSGIWAEAGIIRAVGAMALGPAMYAYYISVLDPTSLQNGRHWPHLLPPACVVVMLASGLGQFLDLLIIASFAGYWIASVRLLLARSELQLSGLNDQDSARSWLRILAAMMLANLLVEIGVTAELTLGKPLLDALSLNIGVTLFFTFNCIALLLVLSRAPLLEWMHQLKPWPARPIAPESELQAVFERWLQLISERELYRSEHSVTLAQAGRMLGVPSRLLSQAINSCYGASFSRHLNDLRVARAQSLLKDMPSMAVTDVYMEAGFSTKSHFHREFARVTGLSPSDYRRIA
jgi:AraC-like DNA-binding protein